jgi:hypothetical protein
MKKSEIDFIRFYNSLDHDQKGSIVIQMYRDLTDLNIKLDAIMRVRELNEQIKVSQNKN